MNNEQQMLWHERGGAGSTTVLLLHGLGATAAVWNGVREALDSQQLAWIAPDLSGHGRSPSQTHYSVGQLAAQIAPLLEGAGNVYVLGHSLGVYVGLALASGWFAARISGVVGVGPKVTWTDADLQSMRELAAKPARRFAQEDEALQRYRRASGLDVRTAADPKWLERGITRDGDAYRLAQDPRTFLVAGAPFESLVASSTAKVMLARGEGDRMVSLEELRKFVPDARDIAGTGHNAQVEKPAAVVELLRELMERR